MIPHRHLISPIQGSRGFTLIETLVAVMILAISLVVVMQLFSGGLKANRIANDYLYGIFHAREKMEELLLMPELLPGSLSGEFDDGYQWRAVVDLIGEEIIEGEAEAPKLPVSTLGIHLEILWTSGLWEKRYAISTTALMESEAVEETAD
jgi:general secretion pathway protein I